jgi:hypothetical protein
MGIVAPRASCREILCGNDIKKEKRSKKERKEGLWKLTPLMEIRPLRGFPQRLAKSLANNARPFHCSHSPYCGIASNFFDIHQGGGPNERIKVGQIELTNSL